MTLLTNTSISIHSIYYVIFNLWSFKLFTKKINYSWLLSVCKTLIEFAVGALDFFLALTYYLLELKFKKVDFRKVSKCKSKYLEK